MEEKRSGVVYWDVERHGRDGDEQDVEECSAVMYEEIIEQPTVHA